MTTSDHSLLTGIINNILVQVNAQESMWKFHISFHFVTFPQNMEMSVLLNLICLEGPYFHIFPVTFTDIIDDVYYLIKLFYIGIKLIFHDD